MPCQSVTANYSLVYAGTSNDVFGSSATDRIISMNSTIGLGSESSNLSLVLAGQPGTNAFGVTPQEQAGRAVNFQCNGFTFGGMIKSLVNSEDASGNTTKVNIVCAKELLAKYDILINKTACSFDIITASGNSSIISSMNGKNAHAELERRSLPGNTPCNKRGIGVGSLLPGPIDNGGRCSVYGASNNYGSIDRGSSSYAQILRGIDGQTFGLRIHTIRNFDRIYVNLSPIRSLAASIPYAKTSAYKINLLELCNAVCDEAGYDFHCSMNGNIIIFNLVNKKIETVFGSVANIINAAKSNYKCISSSLGAEFKNEKTNRVVVGGRLHYIKETNFQQDAKHHIVLGFNEKGQVLNSDRFGFYVPVNTVGLSAVLSEAGFSLGDYVMIHENEFISCGNLDTWKLYGIMNNASFSAACLRACGLGDQANRAWSKIRTQGNVHAVARSCVEAVKFLSGKNTSVYAYEQICYPFFRQLYDQYYGTYYAVEMLNQTTCYRDPTGFSGSTGVFLGEGGAAHLMDRPVQAGWPDDENQVLGFNNLAVFRDGSGKLEAFCRFPVNDFIDRGGNGVNGYSTVFDPSGFSGDLFKQDNNYYVKLEVDGRSYKFNNGWAILFKVPRLTHSAYLPISYNNSGLRAIYLCGRAVNLGFNGFGSGAGTTDTTYANIFKENYAAGRWFGSAIPFVNDNLTYGPWKAGNFFGGTGGGVDIQVKEDLNPWEYGGYQNLMDAGSRSAYQGLPSRTRYESGHVTIAESPAKSLGSVQAGPLLASVVVKFDKSGSTTTYNYETYKPKFGNYAENFNDLVKKNVSDRRDNFNVLKANRLESMRVQQEARKSLINMRKSLGLEMQNGASQGAASVANIIVASYADISTNEPARSKAEVGLAKSYTSDIYQDGDYYRYAAVGLDMIFSPFSTTPNSYMAAYLNASITSGPYKTGPWPRMPPYVVNGQVQNGFNISNWNLNPYLTEAAGNAYMADRAPGGFGIQTDYLTWGTIDDFYDPNNNKQSTLAVRGAAIRGPIVVHGWGYDINGKPVPNQNPSSPNKNFAYNWLTKPVTWPTGPIDLRWDASRGVWVSPPNERLVAAQLLQDLSYMGSAQAVIYGNNPDVTSDNGTRFTGRGSPYPCDQLPQPGSAGVATITVYDFIGRVANKGTTMLVYHTANGNYTPISYGDTYKTPSFKLGCCTSDDATSDKTHPCYLNESPRCPGYVTSEDLSALMVEGYAPDGSKVLHDLSSAWTSPDIWNDKDQSQTKVLGYTTTNALGFPCMTGIPIVDCTGEYPGDGDPNDPIGPCPPGFIPSPITPGRCVRRV